MKSFFRSLGATLLLAALFSPAQAATTYQETLTTFRHAGESSIFFSKSYGYAVFPNVGSGAVGIGGAYGKGRVYAGGKWVGYTDMKQVSVGIQLGGKSYSQIVFFEDKRAFDEFTSGKFEFGADASVTAVTAGANANAGTGGVTKGTSEGPRDANTQGKYNSGYAVFVVQKGGLMAGASVAGQKFSFETRDEHVKQAEAE
jgi:lipid-binding SYLF domain-containing protein